MCCKWHCTRWRTWWTWSRCCWHKTKTLQTESLPGNLGAAASKNRLLRCMLKASQRKIPHTLTHSPSGERREHNTAGSHTAHNLRAYGAILRLNTYVFATWGLFLGTLFHVSNVRGLPQAAFFPSTTCHLLCHGRTAHEPWAFSKFMTHELAEGPSVMTRDSYP